MSEPVMRSRLSYIVHKGVRILHIDHSEVVDLPAVEAAQAFFEMARKEVASQPAGSVRMLTTMSPRLRFNTELTTLERQFVQANTPYMKRSAVVGLPPLGKAILATLRFASGRDIRAFDTAEEALDWLAQ